MRRLHRDLRPADRHRAPRKQRRAAAAPREVRPALHDERAERPCRSRSTATAAVRDRLFVEDNCEALDLLLHEGEPGEVVQHRRRQPALQHRGGRGDPRPAREATQPHHASSTTAPATTAATASTSTRSRRSAGRPATTSTPRSRRPSRWYRREPLVVGARPRRPVPGLLSRAVRRAPRRTATPYSAQGQA